MCVCTYLHICALVLTRSNFSICLQCEYAWLQVFHCVEVDDACPYENELSSHSAANIGYSDTQSA